MNDDNPTDTDEVRANFRTALIVTGILLLIQVALNLWAIQQLPEDSRIPLHWNTRGEVDGWGGRGTLWIMPAVVVGMALLFQFLPRIEPRRGHLLRSSKAYQATWIGTIGVFTVMQCAIVFTALGKPVSMNLLMGLSFGLMFMMIGNYFGKIRSNFFFGIRNPWTLTSELAWNRTHRFGGKLFMALGLLIFVSALINGNGSWIYGVLIGGLLVLVLVTSLHSYLVWKSDPNRKPKSE